VPFTGSFIQDYGRFGSTSKEKKYGLDCPRQDCTWQTLNRITKP
jgi:hypothetical protein